MAETKSKEIAENLTRSDHVLKRASLVNLISRNRLTTYRDGLGEICQRFSSDPSGAGAITIVLAGAGGGDS
jgi:hypothetical protein